MEIDSPHNDGDKPQIDVLVHRVKSPVVATDVILLSKGGSTASPNSQTSEVIVKVII